MQIYGVTGFHQTHISHLASELAILSANRGQRTCLVDATSTSTSNLKSILGLVNQQFRYSFADWLNDDCSISSLLHNITHSLNISPGEFWFISGKSEAEDNDFGFDQIEALCSYLENRFDVCVICTSPGLHNESLAVIAICDKMYGTGDLEHTQQTAVLVDIAQALDVPGIQLIIYGIPLIEFAGLQKYLSTAFQCPVAPTLLSSIGHAVLTSREIEVINLMAAGETNKNISFLLGCSPRSVNNIISEIYRKLGVCSRAELVAYGVKTGVE